MKKNTPTQVTYRQFQLFIIAVLVVFVAFTIALLVLNNRLKSLEDNPAVSSGSLQNSLMPACGPGNTWMDSSGSSGTITSINGSDVTISGYPDQTFHLCDSVKIYNITSGKAISRSALKVGEGVFSISANLGGYITELKVST